MPDSQDSVYSIATSPNFKRDRLVFAAKESGLYRSNDGGKTWSDSYATLKLTAPPPTTFVAVSIIDDITYVFAAAEGKILRSLNGGFEWEAGELDSLQPLVTSLAVSPNFAHDGLLLAATMQDGIFYSTDRGVKWQGWNFGLYDSNINALAFPPHFTGEQMIVAGTQSGVFISINAGRSWRDLDFPIEAAPVLCTAISQENVIYIGTEAHGVYRSEDVGQSWEQIQAGTVEHILIDSNNKILILRDGELLFSMDRGKSWHTRTLHELDSAIICLCAPQGLDPTNPVLVGLANGEIVIL
jgi:photosystem II stability/assembly factor-like uncharacterized protein